MTNRSEGDLKAAIAVTRFGLGARIGELATASHDPRGWLYAQITPAGADLPSAPGGQPLPSAQDRMASFFAFREAVQASGKDEVARKAAAQPLNDATAEELMARAWLAATTPSPFRERWALFWSNHLTVSAAKGEQLNATAAAFEREAIRPHVFGRFEDLLEASTHHPAMLMYLDQEQSIGPDSPEGLRRAAKGAKRGGLNENLGREIMELHTLGPDAGYSQADVTEFARALTGWSMGGRNGPVEDMGAFVYRPNFHEPGSRRVFGRTYPPGNEAQARAILADLAGDPHTSARLARKLAAHFVADDPPPSLVARLDRAFRDSRGDLSVLAQTLVAAPEGWTSAPAKLKTPYEFLISSYRLAGYGPADAKKDVTSPLSALGHRPLAAPQPNGWSDMAADWAAPDAIVKRISWAQGFAGAHAPSADPLMVADMALGARLSGDTQAALRHAESRPEAFALLLMSPEFQRR